MFRRDIRDRLTVPTPPPSLPAASVTIGRVRFGELPALARVQRRAFRPDLAYGLATLVAYWMLPRTRFLVARHGDMVVGCAIGDRQGRDVRVIMLAVDPSMRRRGIGTALLRALAAELPGGNLLLMVEADNQGAQALYRREGYRPVGTAVDYYGRGRSGIWMQKDRDPHDPTTPPTIRV